MERQLERMLAGLPYRPSDPELVGRRARARQLADRFNRGDAGVLGELFSKAGGNVEIVPPFFCDYGSNISFGDRVFVNTGCVILDCAPVDIGDDVQIGPGVHIYAATHPLDPAVRRTGVELAAPVTIESDVWLGGGCVICPGVTIGAGAAVGAGSVVVADVPPLVVAAGNPCRVIRAIERQT